MQIFDRVFVSSVAEQERVAYMLAEHFKQDPEVFLIKPGAVLNRMYDQVLSLMDERQSRGEQE